MSLSGDWKDAKKLWATSSPMGKMIIIISLFVTTSSITSLSDAIFKWKSFILDGVYFYNQHLLGSIGKLFEFIGLNYTRVDTNVMMLMSLTLGSLLRAIGFKKICSSFKNEPLPDVIFVAGTIYFFISLGTIESDAFSYFWMFIYFIFYISAFIHAFRIRKDDFEGFIRFTTVPFISIFTVLVLGAINSGLSM